MKIADYEVPEDLYYDDYHFWCRPEGDEVVIGMDDFAQRLAGDIVFVQLPFVGKAVDIKFNVQAREYNGRWYIDLGLRSIAMHETERPVAAPVPAPAPAPTKDDDDDPNGGLPF